MIELRDVHKAFGSNRVLRGVNLTVGDGEFVSLFGPNGAGKTTTIKVVCRMLKHRGGSLAFDGQDIAGPG